MGESCVTVEANRAVGERVLVFRAEDQVLGWWAAAMGYAAILRF